MESYARHWQELIFTSHLGLERYWITIGTFAAACLLIGAASYRLRLLAVAATAIVFVAYVAAFAPIMVWASWCASCRASLGAGYGGEDITRSTLLLGQHAFLAGFFFMGIAAIWAGVLLSQGVKAIMARRPVSITPPRTGEGPGEGS